MTTQKTEAVCIAGMHRSGTSMVTRLLHLCGLYLGPDDALLGPTAHNTDGHWEYLKLMELNEEILGALGGGWDHPPALPERWSSQPDFRHLKAKAEVILQDFSGRDFWGWKDPRNCLTLPFWLNLVPDAKVIICLRNPLEVARSLRERNWLSTPLSIALWTTYNERVLSTSVPGQRLITHYDSYFPDPTAELRRVFAFLGRSVSEEALEKCRVAAKAGLHHHRLTTEDMLEAKVAPEACILYAKMCDDAGQKDRVNPQAVPQVPMVNFQTGLLARLVSAQRENEQLLLSLTERDEKLREAEGDLASLSQKHTEDRCDSSRRLEDASATLQQTRNALLASSQKLRHLEGKLSFLHRAHVERERAATRRIHELTKTREQTRQALSHSDAKLRNAEHDFALLHQAQADQKQEFQLRFDSQNAAHAALVVSLTSSNAALRELRDEQQRMAEAHEAVQAGLDLLLSKRSHGRLTAGSVALRAVRATDERHCLLTVVHDGEGGTALSTDDLLAELSNELRCVVLKTGVQDWKVIQCTGGKSVSIAEYHFSAMWRFDQPLSQDRISALREICAMVNVDVAHVRHLIGNGPCVIEHLKSLGIPVLFSFHDFYTVCPTIHLLDENGIHCGGRCTATPGECTPTPYFFQPPLPPLKHRFVFTHRERMARSLQLCDAFATTSESTKRLLVAAFPCLKEATWHLIDHGRDLRRYSVATRPSPGLPTRVLCLGNLDRVKGTDLICELMKLDAAEGARFEFHFVGRSAPDFEPAKLGGICHGPYNRQELPTVLGTIQPSFCIIASRWETYCHTLTESWSMGIPVFASSVGALKERIEKHGGGWLLDHRDAKAWYRGMTRVLDDLNEFDRQTAVVDRIPITSAREMAKEYLLVFRRLLHGPGWGREILRGISRLDTIHEESRERAVQEQAQVRRELDEARAALLSAQSRSDEFSKAASYGGLIARIRDAVDAVVPPGATILSVSKGDDQLVKFGRRRAWHFPRDESGVYAGHYPGSSEEAINHLDEQLARGAKFFLFPQTAFWWLEHYPGLRTHLDLRFRCVWQDASCRIYQRARRPWPDRVALFVQALRRSTLVVRGLRHGRLRGAEVVKRSPPGFPISASPKSVSAGFRLSAGAYAEIVRGIQGVVDRRLPPDEVIVVVSKGDDDLVRFSRHRGWHFPQMDNGVYAGHYPATDDDAVKQLESLRKKGARYLLFPQTGFWWFEHYPRLEGHLRKQYRRVWRDKTCAIYDLSPSSKFGWTRRAKGTVVAALGQLPKRGVRRPSPIQGEHSRDLRYTETMSTNGRGGDVALAAERPITDGVSPAAARMEPPAAVTAPTVVGIALAAPVPNETRPLDPALVTIVVPVYNAFDDVQRCMESLLRHTKHPHQTLIIDDFSSDPRVWPMLASHAGTRESVRVIRHSTNKGFTATVNEGCRLAPGDVVLLNSDTRVTEDWLEKLSACAASADDIGTVTAVSNAAGAFSVPENHTSNDIPAQFSIDEIGRLVERLSPRVWPRVPTGNGFCLYIKRRVFNAVGFFDEKNFPRGYGEENEFCMRAAAKGFKHVIDDATYVYHKHGASFGPEKSELMASGTAALLRLYPDYTGKVATWLRADPLDSFRSALANALNSPKRLLSSSHGKDPRPVVLVIIHDGSGGTLFMAEDLIRQLEKEFRCLLLKTGLRHWMLFDCLDRGLAPVRKYSFGRQWSLQHAPDPCRIRVLQDICNSFEVELAHIHHLIGNSAGLVDHLKAMRIPVVFSFHDFYTVCPTIQLIDDRGQFCGGRCSSGDGECKLAPNLFPQNDRPVVKHHYVYQHRAEADRSLRLCDCFVAPSESVRTVLLRAFPFLNDARLKITEHGRDVSRRCLAVPPQPDRVVRVACFGNIDHAKGADLIEEVMALDAAQGRRFEFHFVGNKAREFKPENRGGIYHGPYSRDSLPQTIEKIGPSFAMIPSICSETYCYTLTEAWAMGLPVLASDIGALKERIARHGGGWRLDFRDPKEWYRRMVEILDTPGAFETEVAKIPAIPVKSVSEMTEDYRQIYHSLLHPTRLAQIINTTPVVGLSDTFVPQKA